MPRTPVRVLLGIGHLGQRGVRGLPVGDGRRPVDRGADKRVPEGDLGPQPHQALGLGRGEVVEAHAEPVAGPPEQAGIAERLGGGERAADAGSPRAASRRARGTARRPGRPAGGRSRARPRSRRPGRRPPVTSRENSSRASGLPAASARIRSRTCSSSLAGYDRGEQGARVGVGQPGRGRAPGKPASSANRPSVRARRSCATDSPYEPPRRERPAPAATSGRSTGRHR